MPSDGEGVTCGALCPRGWRAGTRWRHSDEVQTRQTRCHVLRWIGVLSPEAAGGVFLGSVVPGAGERLAVHDLMDAMKAGPLSEVGDKVLLDPVAEDIAGR
jgi:hypothetical protein